MRVSGLAFDAAFLEETVRIKAEDVRAFRREAARTANPQIRSFVMRFLPVDEKHEAGARELRKRSTGSLGPYLVSATAPQRRGVPGVLA